LQNQAKNSAFNHRFYNLFSDILSSAVFKQAYRLGQRVISHVDGCFVNKSAIYSKKENTEKDFVKIKNLKTKTELFTGSLLKQAYRLGQRVISHVDGLFINKSTFGTKEAQALIKNSIQGTRNVRSVGQYGRILPICAKDTPHFWSDVYKLGTRARKAQADLVQGGRSMIEMLGVLAIIGVLSVGGIAGYTKAMMKVKINKTISQISQISANIRSLYASQEGYGGLNDTVLKKAKIISDDMTGTSHSGINKNNYWGSKTDLTNPFGGGFWVKPYTDLAYSFNGFFLVLNGIPEDACMELLTLDWGSSAPGLRGIGLTYMTGIFLYSSDAYGVRAEDLPISVSLAASYCSGNDNHMSFGFE
jgi:type II secretory pathway pseudopilin PulG